VGVNSSYSTPFEVQLLSSNVSAQGISLLVSSTSATQIHSLFVSYIVYDPFIQNLVVGSYVYNKYTPTSSLLFTPPIGVSRNNLAFHGFNGFIVSNGGSFGLGASLTNGNLTFAAVNHIYYLSYNYFFLIGGPCGQCVGYHINLNGSCVATCPPSSYYNGVTCITCKTGDVWNGKECVTPAPVVPPTPVNPNNPNNSNNGNQTTPANLISCPAGTYWDGQQLRCLPCKTGCATCVDCYSCSTCSLGYYSPKGNPFCEEICGDGKRFILPCDDGNSVSGDGCSSTCEV
jgi:cysteine-rich repeat protein